MTNEMAGYIIGSVHERDRIGNIDALKTQIPSLQYEEAIYPDYIKVPFLERLKDLSLERTGHRLSNGELGCLLSHRKVWRKIIESDREDNDMFLVLESDSNFADIELLKEQFTLMAQHFDLFFWGAWEGHMKLFNSSKKKLSGGFAYGTPYIKTVYCTYGYSLNKKAAAYLLRKTNKIRYPVDQFKKFVHENELRIGGVSPELINTTGRKKSYIQQNRNSVKEFFIWIVLDIKNSIICFFK
jgi:glycosyl transferase family 25